MKIVCPSCEARYEVPEVVLTSRRKMRCARCGTQWVPADIHADPSGLPVAAVVQVADVAADPAALSGIPADIAPAGLELAAPHQAEPDFVLVDPELDAHPEFSVPDSEIVLEAPARPVALRRDTNVTILPGTNTLSRNSLPHAAMPAAGSDGGTPVLAWGGSIALVVVALAAVVIFRAPVMKAWPPSTRLYLALGLSER